MRLGSFEMTNIFNNQTPVAVTSGIQYKTKGEVSYVTSYTMTKQSQSKDAAWRYLKFLTSREAQQFVVERSRVPMRRDVRMPDTSRTMLTGLINSLGTAMVPLSPESNYIQSAVNSGMAWFDQSPAAAFRKLRLTRTCWIIVKNR